jgi:hypothetical protein
MDVTLLLVKRLDKFFLAVKTIQEHFALLVCLKGTKMRFIELPILAMRLHNRGWQGERMGKSVFGGRKNLENAMLCTGLDIATDMELDAREMWKGKGSLCGCI